MPPDGDILVLPPATTQIGRRAPLVVDVVRSLDDSDIPALLESNAPPQSGQQALVRIRTSHHRLAELLANGTSPTDAGLITGYSTGYISILKGDPSFQELMAYYAGQKATEFADLLMQLKIYASDLVSEMQERLSTDPNAFSLSELRAQLEAVAKVHTGIKGALPAQAGGSVPSLRIEFVSAPARGPMLEGTIVEAPPVDVLP